MEKDDRARQAALFRERLAKALADAAVSRSALARAVGVDRSTVSQLLSGEESRMPNARVVAGCATALGVSADWLLGLTERPERLADLMAHSLSVTEAPRTLVDEQIYAWHREAAGYKIRHVPATLPDMFKTRALMEWEYESELLRTARQAIGAAEDRLSWMRESTSDYEVAVAMHEIESCARGEGYYAGLPLETRRAQIARLAELGQQLYPRLRIHLFDARRVFSAPITIFGPLLAVLYLGRHYVAFRDTARVASFADHFDWLVREASCSARDAPAQLWRLHDGVFG